MGGNFDPNRVAKTESLFREVNERIAETADRFEADDATFVCECADAQCTDRVETTLEQYEWVRSDGTRFLVVNGHEDDRYETVVHRRQDFAVVEKDHPDVVPIVRELDPREAA